MLSELLGVEISIAIDIVLALGSTESIVESLYSVMKSQAMPGGQDNNNCLVFNGSFTCPT